MGRSFVGGRVRVGLRGIKTGVLIRGTRVSVNVAATQVVSDVSTAVVVVGVVNQRFNFSIEITTRINNVQPGDTSFDCQRSEVKFVDILLRLELG